MRGLKYVPNEENINDITCRWASTIVLRCALPCTKHMMEPKDFCPPLLNNTSEVYFGLGRI